jgi:hypothetical protein
MIWWQLICLFLYVIGIFPIWSYLIEQDHGNNKWPNFRVAMLWPIVVPLSMFAEWYDKRRKKEAAQADEHFRMWEAQQRQREFRRH